jgi:hypothetical protein
VGGKRFASPTACRTGGEAVELFNGDVAILATAGKLQPLGKPMSNTMNFFSAIELFELLADPDWLDESTMTIIQYWRRKNARRKGIIVQIKSD